LFVDVVEVRLTYSVAITIAVVVVVVAPDAVLAAVVIVVGTTV
jgi:hypothetical protein